MLCWRDLKWWRREQLKDDGFRHLLRDGNRSKWEAALVRYVGLNWQTVAQNRERWRKSEDDFVQAFKEVRPRKICTSHMVPKRSWSTAHSHSHGNHMRAQYPEVPRKWCTPHASQEVPRKGCTENIPMVPQKLSTENMQSHGDPASRKRGRSDENKSGDRITNLSSSSRRMRPMNLCPPVKPQIVSDKRPPTGLTPGTSVSSDVASGVLTSAPSGTGNRVAHGASSSASFPEGWRGNSNSHSLLWPGPDMEAEVGLQTQLPLPPPLESPPEQPSDAEDDSPARPAEPEEVDWSFGNDAADANAAAADPDVPDDDVEATQQELDAANAAITTAVRDTEMPADASNDPAQDGPHTTPVDDHAGVVFGSSDAHPHPSQPKPDKSHIAGLSLPLDSLIPAAEQPQASKRSHRGSVGQAKKAKWTSRDWRWAGWNWGADEAYQGYYDPSGVGSGTSSQPQPSRGACSGSAVAAALAGPAVPTARPYNRAYTMPAAAIDVSAATLGAMSKAAMPMRPQDSGIASVSQVATPAPALPASMNLHMPDARPVGQSPYWSIPAPLPPHTPTTPEQAVRVAQVERPYMLLERQHANALPASPLKRKRR